MGPFILCLFIVSWAAYCEGTLSTLDSNSLKHLDTFVRREILHKIVAKLNETTFQENIQSKACELKVNNSFTSCTTCFNNICQQTQQSTGIHLNFNSILTNLVPLIFKPQLICGSIVDLIGSGLPSAVDLLGSGGKLFIEKVGELAKELSHTFADGSSVLHSISSEFEKLGNQFVSETSKVLNEIKGGAEHLFSITSSGAGDLLNQVGHEAQNLLNSLQSAGSAITSFGQTVGDNLKNLGSTVGHKVTDFFHSIFGKRQSHQAVKRCTTSCPICNTLDLKVHTKEEVLTSVCGAQYLTEQASTVDYLESLRYMLNVTITKPLITEVTYNPASIMTDNGVHFSTSFFSFVQNRDTTRVKTDANLSITDLESTARKIADQIWSLTQ